MSKVVASYPESAGLDSFGGASAMNFAGTVTLYDTHEAVIMPSVCVDAGDTAMFFSKSKQARPAALWKQH